MTLLRALPATRHKLLATRYSAARRFPSTPRPVKGETYFTGLAAF